MQPTPRSPVPGIIALAIGLVLAWALVGLPLVALGIGQLLAWAHRVPAGKEEDKRALAAGWIAMVILAAAVFTGGVFGVSTIELLEETFAANDPALAVTALLAPLAAGLLFAPLAFAPSLALHASRPLWIVEAVWLAAHRGLVPTGLVGLALGAHAAGPIALGWACAEWIDDDLVPLALLGGGGLTVLLAPLSLRLLADGFARAREQAADPTNAERALGSLGRLAALPLVVLGVVIAICAATPARARTVEHETDGGTLPLVLPGTQVTLDTHYHGIVVRTPSGSITVPVDGWIWQASATADPVQVDGRDAWRVRVSTGDSTYLLVLDADGHRLDDGIVKRIRSRIPNAAIALLSLACLLGVGFAVHAGRVRATVRTVAHVISARAGHDVTAGTLVLRGTTARVASGQLIGAGGAAIESEGGALRVALPGAPVAVLAVDPSVGAEPAEGTPVVLVSRGARLAGVGLREASAPFPPGGALVIGDPERGCSALVRASFPWLVRIGLAIGGLVTLASFALAGAT